MSKLKRLIIVDLNGFLIQRVHKIEYNKNRSLFETEYRLNKLPRPDQTGNFYVWFRPNVRDFIFWLMDNFHVAIWSSVMRHNIEPIVNLLLPSQHERRRLLFWWNQEHCLQEKNPNETDPKKATSFYKCLSNVWDDAEILDRWSQKQPDGVDLRDHTLMIDDSVLKVRDNPKNTAIHPRTWKLFDLNEQERHITVYKDNVLEDNGSLQKWLEDLLKWDGTVAEYVEKHPYTDPPLEEVAEERKSDGWDYSAWGDE